MLLLQKSNLISLLAYFFSLIMGFVLGLLGAGGAILTIPILVYLVGLDAQIAITYSLFIVCITSITGGLRYIYYKQVHFNSIIAFGIPSVIAVWFVRKFVLPSIPDIIIHGGSINLNKSSLLLFLFAILMLLASYKMIQPSGIHVDQNEVEKNYSRFILNGIIVGCITGLLGAGGGFLIVPALVIIQKLDFKIAAGTSLCVVAINSAIGFLSNTAHLKQLDWPFLLIFTGISIIGIFIGSYLSSKYASQKLRPVFGYLLILIAMLILYNEIHAMVFSK